MRLLAPILLATLGLAPAPDDRPITAEERDHWAFRPVVRPAVPPLGPGGRNPIDGFVGKALAESGLKPSPEASREALIRRLSFDLRGLPPSPEEVAAFLADESPDAYGRLVDRLLASPAYGERWAQHWLDLARYADTDGFEFDQARPNAWRYRDWVVSALNADMPYDRFVRLQLAGDEVAPDDSDAFIATGFNRCYPDMVDLNDQGLRRQNALNDITETTGLVFLGLTIGCARCHDHKFDPIRQADFYRLQAYFAPARFRDDFPVAAPADRRTFEQAREVHEAKVARLAAAIIGVEAPIRTRLAPTPPGASDDLIAALQRAPGERTRRDLTSILDAQAKDKRIEGPTLAALLGPVAATARLVLLDDLGRVRKGGPRPLPVATGLEGSDPGVKTYLLRRGDYAAKGPEVGPEPPRVLVADGSAPPTRGRRAELADWLVAPGNPLTARVMVNRIWQGHFGRGIVTTPSDFGTQGVEPTHPELLDWLAAEFVSRGWSLKALHRRIVSSATYRQSSGPVESARVVDPSNDLFWRQDRRRLDGEAIRDALLSASGRLNPARGGPCVFPELPVELTKQSAKGAIWPVSPRPEDRDRRSLYVFTRRNLRYPFFEVFDRPDTNASCPRRPSSTIAPQALTLLNGRLSNGSARALAVRVGRESTTVAGRVDRAYRLAIGRPPDREETRLAAELLGEGGAGALEDFCLALLNTNEFIYID